ncbi:MAG: AraC family transcriptional regulator [Cyclobacteriaceae bacterium]|nr:MAG: AraC family transcriptional regulator [Cyclobacteriaceae bacterium]
MKVLPFQVPHITGEAYRFQEDRVPHFYDRFHSHEEVQIMYILAGEGLVVAGDYVGRFEPGDVFVLGSYLPHVFRNDEAYYRRDSPGAHALSVYFTPAYLGEEFWRLNEMASVLAFLKRARRGYRVTGPARYHLGQQIALLQQAKGVERITGFLVLLDKMANGAPLEALSMTEPSPQQGGQDRRMSDVLEFTFREYHRRITLREVAEVAHLSPQAFCRYFRQHTRKSYVSFLQEVRIRKACQLLTRENLSIENVCYAVGFQNISNFNRVFKRITRQTPKTYLTRRLWY